MAKACGVWDFHVLEKLIWFAGYPYGEARVSICSAMQDSLLPSNFGERALGAPHLQGVVCCMALHVLHTSSWKAIYGVWQDHFA